MAVLRKIQKEIFDKNSKCRKVTKTIFLVCTWICIGLTLEIQGPTFKDLEIQTGASTEAISRAISGRSAGYFIGSFIGGFLVDKLINYCDLMIAICLDGIAVSTVAVPWSPNSVLLWVLFTLQGTFEGVINIAGQKLIMVIWKRDAPSPLHVLHLGFGIGSLIVPNIANPFLAVPAPMLSPSNGSGNVSANISSYEHRSVFETENVSMNYSKESIVETSVLYLKESRIGSAYFIVAIITAALSIVFYCYQFVHRKKDKLDEHIEKIEKNTETLRKKSFREIIDPATCAHGDRTFGIIMFSLLFFFYINAVGGERILGKFIRNYSIDQLDFSVDEGSMINTFFWISFSIGRFSGFIAARWIPIRTLLPIEAFGALVSSILLNIFARDSATMLWVFILPVGFFEAPMFPSAMGWADSYLEMSGTGITFLLLGGASGGIAYMFIIGYFYDNYGNLSFLYQVLAFGIIAASLAVLLTIAGRGRGNRYDTVTKSDSYHVEETEDISDDEIEHET